MLIVSSQKLSKLSESLELSIDDLRFLQNKYPLLNYCFGILTDDNVAWHSHIDKLSKKIASGIGAIKRIKPFVSPEILHYTYNVLVKPHFDYSGINCLGELRQNALRKIKKIAESCCSHFDFLLLRLGWKDLIAQRQIQVAFIDGVQSSDGS